MILAASRAAAWPSSTFVSKVLISNYCSPVGLNSLPLTIHGSSFAAIQPPLIPHSVVQIRRPPSLRSDCLQQLENGVLEGVFVADDVTRRPPAFYVRMGWVCCLDRFETTVRSFI